MTQKLLMVGATWLLLSALLLGLAGWLHLHPSLTNFAVWYIALAVASFVMVTVTFIAARPLHPGIRLLLGFGMAITAVIIVYVVLVLTVRID